MKKIKIFILFLFISLSINYSLLFPATQDQDSSAQQERKITRLKNALTDFVVSLPGKLKAKIESFDYDEQNELNFVFSMLFQGKKLEFGLKWDWEAGSGDTSTGFTRFPGELVSPTLGELGVLPSYATSEIKKIRLLNVLLGIGSKTEIDVSNSELIKPISRSLRRALGDKFLTTLNKILILKPVYVFYIKLILLIKSYVSQHRVEEIPNQIIPLLIRLMQTVNVEATIRANGGEKNPRNWTKRIFYSDPEGLVEVLPNFIRDFLKKINIPVPLASYQEWKDRSSGLTDYDKQISETMRRGSIDSEVKYVKENIQPMLSGTKITLTDASMLSYICARFVYNLSKATRNDTTLFTRKFIAKVIKAIKKMRTTNNKHKAMLIKKLNVYKKLLVSEGELEKLPVIDDFVPEGKIEVTVINALLYYTYLLKSNMSYSFYGDKGYLYSDANLGRNYTITNALRIIFRVFKDSRKALRMVAQKSPDIIVRDDDGNTVKIGKESYQEIVGTKGVFDSRGNLVSAGTGALFDYQEASIEYKKASSALKMAKLKYPKGDRRIDSYNKKRIIARKDQLKAKSNLTLAKNKFMLLVIRYFKFKRAQELDAESVMTFLLREFKRLSMRSENLIPLIHSINDFSIALIGLPIFSKEDIEKEDDFDEGLFLEEEEFNYDDIDDPFGDPIF